MEKQKKSDNPLFVSVNLREDWIDHHREWSKCQRCNLYREACNYVLIRGRIPCDVLMIGEAPGKSEDLLGIPFIGPAGKVLDSIIREVKKKQSFSYCIANTVACMPTATPDFPESTREPTTLEQKACFPRLKSLLEMAQPRMIISLGIIAGLGPFLIHCEKEKRVTKSIDHPGHILRYGGVKSPSFKIIVHKFTDIIRHLSNC